MTGALLGLQLYRLARRPRDLAWARRMLGRVDRCPADPSGLVQDHIGLDGSIDPTTWTYNQSTVLGANVLLYRIGGG